jgi:hypothetical protein
MNLKDESLYYLRRTFRKGTLRSKREKSWAGQLEKHQCIFIHITKTAGISVSVSLLGEIIGNMSALYYQSLFGKEKFNRYFKFAFIRNPFTRLISAYEFLKAGGYDILDAKNAEVVKPYKSLEDFVMNYLTPATARANNYFRPQYCFLCDSNDKILTDYLGRFETIEEDYEYIRNKIGTGEPLKKLNVTKAKKLPPEQYYTSDSMIRKVISIYEKDFELLGYSKALSDIL